jgi:hypothetical protein
MSTSPSQPTGQETAETDERNPYPSGPCGVLDGEKDGTRPAARVGTAFDRLRWVLEMTMESQALLDVIRQAEQLDADEQLKLIAHLAGTSLPARGIQRPRRSWMDLEGAAPYPLVGEDAQAWVTRTRAEGAEERERQWRDRR